MISNLENYISSKVPRPTFVARPQPKKYHLSSFYFQLLSFYLLPIKCLHFQVLKDTGIDAYYILKLQIFAAAAYLSQMHARELYINLFYFSLFLFTAYS